MCRLYGFRANELTKVECSLVQAQNALLAQSRANAEGRSHPDGWGIACYGDLRDPDNRIPQLVRHKTTAFEDVRFSHQAEATYAETVVAHVRLATVGYVGALNAHPFTHCGWTFAHHGTLPGFEQLAPQLEQETGRFQDSRLGSTDSEQFFLWLLNRLGQDGVNLAAPDHLAVRESIRQAIPELDRRCRDIDSTQTPRLSFVLTNGRLMYACRWHTPLHSLTRQGIYDCEICGIPHIRHAAATDYRAVVFATEPITHEAWIELHHGSLAGVDESFELTVTDFVEPARP